MRRHSRRTNERSTYRIGRLAGTCESAEPLEMTQHRYSTDGLVEARFEPGSRGRVLANRLGICRVRDIHLAESEALVSLTNTLLDEITGHHRFTVGDIRAWHRRWLGSIYVWAGAYRSVNLSKGGFQFAAADRIPQLVNDYGRDVLSAETPCAGMDNDRLIQALARTHAELVLIHPFREGNGRLARLLNSLMALQSGLPALDYGGIRGAGKRDYIGAIHSALGHDYQPMENVFRNVIKRSLRAANS